MKNLQDNYFYSNEADLFNFYRIPKELFTNPKYKKLCTDAKVLYGLLLDRNSLSIKNNWSDEQNRIYIYFSREEAQEMLGVSHGTIPKLFKQLIEADLIKEVRQGLGKSNIIYVKKFIRAIDIDYNTPQNTDKMPEVKNFEFSNSKNLSSGGQIFRVQEVKIFEANNTNINNTEKNDTYENYKNPSVCLSVPPVDKHTEFQNEQKNINNYNYEIKLKEQTYEKKELYFNEPTEYEKKELEEILKNSEIDLYHEPRKSMLKNCIEDLYYNKILSQNIGLPNSVLRAKLHRLDHVIIDRAIFAYSNALKEGTQVKKPIKYFSKCIWSALIETHLDELNLLSEID